MDKKGFSLIEVMIALVVFSVVALGGFAMQDTALKASREARLTREATDLARTHLERLRATANQIPTSGTSCGLPASMSGFTTTCSQTRCASLSASGACTAATSAATTRAFLVNLSILRSGKTYASVKATLYRP